MTKSHSRELMPSATVESIVLLRNNALVQYDQAFSALEHAQAAIKAAWEAARAASPGINSYNHHTGRHRENFLCEIDLAPERRSSSPPRAA